MDKALIEGIEKVAETDDWLLINKPGGISINDDTEAGLISLLKQHMSYSQLHPVHRLDKVTSGLMLLAKNPEANAVLSAQFQHKSISKLYLALSDRKPIKKQGWVKGGMKKGRSGSWLLTREMDNPAITQFCSQSVQPGLRLFVLKPSTGKTHQLRVAMKSLSAPVLGDSRYAGTVADHCYLHAWQLAFDWQGERFDFQCLPTQKMWQALMDIKIKLPGE